MEESLKVNEILNFSNEKSPEDLIFSSNEIKSPNSTYGIYKLFEKYGNNLEDLPFINLNRRTLRRYKKQLEKLQLFPIR